MSSHVLDSCDRSLLDSVERRITSAQELALHQEAQGALMALFNDTREAYRLLRDALLNASYHPNREAAFSS